MPGQTQGINPTDVLSDVPREIFEAISVAAVIGTTLNALLEIEKLRTEIPATGPMIDAGLRDLKERLCHLPGIGSAGVSDRSSPAFTTAPVPPRCSESHTRRCRRTKARLGNRPRQNSMIGIPSPCTKSIRT